LAQVQWRNCRTAMSLQIMELPGEISMSLPGAVTDVPWLTNAEQDCENSDEACCSICFSEFTDADPRASKADAKGHGIIFACGHAAMLHLSCLKLEAQQARPFQCPLCRTKFGFSKICICGCELQERKCSREIPGYGGAGVQCDHCSRSVSSRECIFHCPRGKVEAHPVGYDVCGTCASQGATQAPAVLPTCSCGHALVYNVMGAHRCDINGPGCKREGTCYRCGDGCDFDACDVCYSAKVGVRHVRRRTHSRSRAEAERAAAASPRRAPNVSRPSTGQSGRPSTGRLLALARSAARWRPTSASRWRP